MDNSPGLRAHDVSGAEATVRVYDSNRGQRDDIWIRFDTSKPTRPTVFEHNLGLRRRPIRGFFRTAYTPTVPPKVLATAASQQPAAHAGHRPL